MEGMQKQEGSNEYRKAHAHAKRTLGEYYDAKRIDGVLALQAPGGFEAALGELEQSLQSLSDEGQRKSAVGNWYANHDVMSLVR